MGIYTSFYVVYGFRLPSDFKKKGGRRFDPFSNKMMPYLEGRKEADGFCLIWDQMGSGQDTVFGEMFANMDGHKTGMEEIDISNLRTERLKELYRELFGEYDVPMDVEPVMLCIVHQS